MVAKMSYKTETVYPSADERPFHPTEFTTVRLKIAGLEPSIDDPSVFELRDVRLAKIGDMGPLMADLIADGFDAVDVDHVIDEMVMNLRRRTLARVLADRTEVL